MVTAVNSTITAPAGTKLHLGVLAPATAFPPLRTGGAVSTLVGDWLGTGFQLLTTAPSAPTYKGAAHGSGVWDDTHGVLWLFGSETHDIDMDNAVYGWRASDGLFIKHYDADDKSGYRMDGNGVYWSSALKNRPWAMHTYRRMRYIPTSNELEVVFDAHEHAFVAPIFENTSQSTADREPPFWYYNVITGQWRASIFGQSATFAGTSFSMPVGHDDSYGWFTHNASTWTRLTPAGVLSTQSISGLANNQEHSYMHVHAGIAYHVGGNANVYLYAKHPLNNIPGSTRYLVADYAALSGKDMTNAASVKMPDGRILLFPTSASGTVIHGLILDPVANTVTDTGFSVTGAAGTTYEMSADWSTANDCAILLFHRFDPDRLYAFRPE